jgi:Flp pilus assembly protein TadG
MQWFHREGASLKAGRNMTKKMRIPPRPRGQSLVEMGLFMMVLLLLLAGAVEFGIGFFSYVAIRDAAQEGALYGSIVYDKDHLGYTVSDFQAMIIDRVENSSTGPVDLKSSSVSVGVVPPSAWCAGYPLKVNVSYQYPISMPLIGVITGPTINLKASATSTILIPPCSPAP